MAGKGKQEVRKHVAQRQPSYRAKELTMSPSKRYIKPQAKGKLRRRLKAQERLERGRRQVQRAAKAQEQTLEDLGLPTELVAEIEGRLRNQQHRVPHYRCTVSRAGLGQELALPPALALPKRSWIERLRRLGLKVLEGLWRHVQDKSRATQSRWQWTWVADDSVLKKYGAQLGLAGTWWSGQEKRVFSGIDSVLLVVVIGDGRLVIPVDFAIRRSNPIGPGAPCRDKLC
jgi:hypothetical protein